MIDQQPWILQEAVDFMTNSLEKESHVFEWGSGGSTAYFSNLVKHVTSIEYNPKWHEQVKFFLSQNHIENVDLHLILPQEIKSVEPVSSNYRTNSPDHINSHFADYVQVIDKFEDNFFDLVLVDGRARVDCINHSMSKVKPGGWLVLDNAERSFYNVADEIMSSWYKQEYFGFVPYIKQYCKTTIWRKPN